MTNVVLWCTWTLQTSRFFSCCVSSTNRMHVNDVFCLLLYANDSFLLMPSCKHVWTLENCSPTSGWYSSLFIESTKLRKIQQRQWCNGQHGCLPSSRSGFDSRLTQILFLCFKVLHSIILLFPRLTQILFLHLFGS